jgi:hypothetical protein
VALTSGVVAYWRTCSGWSMRGLSHGDVSQCNSGCEKMGIWEISGGNDGSRVVAEKGRMFAFVGAYDVRARAPGYTAASCQHHGDGDT